MKLLQSQYLDSFLNGSVFMNTPAFFSVLEAADVVRSDSDEGLHASMQVKELAIADADGQWIPIGGIINPVIHRTAQAADYNMFCMYTLTEGSDEPLDDRNLGFGDTAVLITDAPEFLKRFKTAAAKTGREGGFSVIEYVDRDIYHGPMGPFRKFSSFSYQKEYRMVLAGGNGKPTILGIGDIRDICVVCPSAEINEYLLHRKTMDFR